MTAAGKTPSPKVPGAKPQAAKAAAHGAASESANEICSVRIELLRTDPLIWRELEVPTSFTLAVLHDIIQIAMGWSDSHLWEFTIDKQSYGPPIDEDWDTAIGAEAGKVRLRDVLRPRKTRIDYLYDMGDSWEHRLTVTSVRQGDPGTSYPRYVAGEWAGPPEDCGGVEGFYEGLAALSDPEHPRHADMAEWFEGCDRKEINETPIRGALDRIAGRGRGARTRPAKKKA